jgi:hypothetical protein
VLATTRRARDEHREVVVYFRRENGSLVFNGVENRIRLGDDGCILLPQVRKSIALNFPGALSALVHSNRLIFHEDGKDGLECELDTSKVWGYNAEIKTTVIRGAHYERLLADLKATGMRVSTKRARTQRPE